MYRDEDDYTTVRAFVVKDRTGIHKAGDDIEDPTLLDYQDLIEDVYKRQGIARAMAEQWAGDIREGSQCEK